MFKASALYIVIIIALVIGVLCSALIVSALFYRSQYQRAFRYNRLQNNLSSATNILLAGNELPYSEDTTLDLFNDGEDSVILKRIFWGMYDIGLVKAFIQTDTLTTIFSIAHQIDSAKWGALYLSDEDRAMTVSGNTVIKGDVFLPKAGVLPGYVNDKYYTGDERLVLGKKHLSNKKLPELDQKRLSEIYDRFISLDTSNISLTEDSVSNSFLNSALVFNLSINTDSLINLNLNGNIILRSDTVLTIGSSSQLNNILIFAPAIIVKDGFKGTCQLFATDSIRIGKYCAFGYPSCIGIIKMQTGKVEVTPQLNIGEGSVINGTVFTYLEGDTELMPIVGFEKEVEINGQVYTHGILKFDGAFEVNGSIFTRRFLLNNKGNYLTNTLFDVKINSLALSPYYLSSKLIPVAATHKKILQWLERK